MLFSRYPCLSCPQEAFILLPISLRIEVGIPKDSNFSLNDFILVASLLLKSFSLIANWYEINMAEHTLQ